MLFIRNAANVLCWFVPNHALRDRIRKGSRRMTARFYVERSRAYIEGAPAVAPVKDDKNEKIFAIWFQGEDAAPPLVRSCFRSVRRNCPQPHVVLDDKTLFDYIDLPGAIIDKYRRGQIERAHFADIARVELMHTHGGFWLDATCFCTAPIPKNIVEQDFFLYRVPATFRSGYSFIQNCFIRSRKGAFLLDAWRHCILDYWMNEGKIFDYFMHQILFTEMVFGVERAARAFDEIPKIFQDPTHMLWFDWADKPFDKELFDRLTKDAFFQKTTHKCAAAVNPKPGSFADVVVNM